MTVSETTYRAIFATQVLHALIGIALSFLHG